MEETAGVVISAESLFLDVGMTAGSPLRKSPVNGLKKHGERKFILLCSALVLLNAATVSAQQKPVQENKSTAMPASPFAAVIPEPFPNPTEETNLVQDWFEYPITSGKGSFVPVLLPFEYTATVDNPDPNQSYTFPHLLSFKLDWIPNNTSNRRPFFIFKRDQRALPKPRGASVYYKKIFVRSWHGTYGIGGSLHESPEGWTGSMHIFEVAHIRSADYQYKTPRSYFRLMADMALDVFAFAEQPVSEELRAEIEKPFTNNKEALRLLGQAAVAKERSEAEWNLYRKILALDPNFAEVRYWDANQRSWVAGKHEIAQAAYAQATASRIVIPALKSYDSAAAKDPSMSEVMSEALQRAARLSPQNPFIAYALARQRNNWESLSIEDLTRLEGLAKSNPGNGMFLYQLAYEYEVRAFPHKAIPIALSEINSGFLWGNDRSWTWLVASHSYENMGDWKRAFYCAMQGLNERPDSPELIWSAARSLHELCRFAEAARLYEAAYKQAPAPYRLNAWVLCLYEGGFRKKAIEVQETYKEIINNDSNYFIIWAANEIFSGRVEEGRKFLFDFYDKVIGNTKDRDARGEIFDQYMILCIEAGYLGNFDNYTSFLYEKLFFRPHSRRGLILLDLWERRQRGEVSCYLYDAYTWLCPEDQWFVQARKLFENETTGAQDVLKPEVKNISKILQDAKLMDAMEAYDMLHNKLKPMMVEWNIKKLLDAGESEAAERLANLYEEAASHISSAEFSTALITRSRYVHRLADMAKNNTAPPMQPHNLAE